MGHHADLLPGTLDLLILKAASLGPLHGYGVLLSIAQISGGALDIEQGALYRDGSAWCRPWLQP
jgi:DNA-binding PadR family transcriptional regulator